MGIIYPCCPKGIVLGRRADILSWCAMLPGTVADVPTGGMDLHNNAVYSIICTVKTMESRPIENE